MALKEGRQKVHKYWSVVFIILILILLLSAFCIGVISIQSIRSNVRNTTIQVIQEITNSKSQMLTSMLEESEREIRSLAAALDVAKDKQSINFLLEKFEREHRLDGLTILDDQGYVIYGSSDAYIMKGVPSEFTIKVASDGFAVSDTLIGVEGDHKILFGTMISGNQFLYASLSTNLMQKACGETTYLGEGYSYVLGQGGDIVIPPVRYSYEQVYKDIRSLLIYNGNPSKEVDRFIEALDSGLTGSVVFNIDGKKQLLCFQPVYADREWYFVTVVVLNAVEKNGAQILKRAMYMVAIIIGVIVVALAVGLFFYLSMHHKQQESDRFLLNIYQAISKNTDTVIFILDSKGSRPDYVFENSKRLLGISAEEFLDNQEEEKSAFKRELQNLLQEQWPKEVCKKEIHTYNDRLHQDMWLKILICPFHLSSDMKCIYAITDVTQEHNDREKIAAAVVVAEQANAAKSSFFSNMSHDMRTPMNGIVGMTAIAKRNLDDKDRVLDCLNKIDFSSKHLLGLINDVLDMSKIESGKLALNNEPFDLIEMLQGLEVILRPQCESKQQTLTFSFHISHSKLLGDSLRLSQIFMNLLSNAEKFTPEGGTISLTAQEQEQNTAGFATYRFTVADNGIGITTDVQKVIFTPFERAGDMKVRQIEGTGLGLAITKNLVSAMSGQITLESTPGQGTSFFVDLKLPLQETKTIEHPVLKDVNLNETSFARRRFLIAEDNAINQEIVEELLTGYGAIVDTADNGKQALEKFMVSAVDYYDAILMDIQMPIMDGYEATRKIRACNHPQAKTVCIVAMTANVFAEDVLAAKNAGMDAHISKPIDLKHLYQVLEVRMKVLD